MWLLVEGARVLRWVGVNHRRVQNLAQFEKDDPDAGWDSIIESWHRRHSRRALAQETGLQAQ